jgi:hypothetical protein
MSFQASHTSVQDPVSKTKKLIKIKSWGQLKRGLGFNLQYCKKDEPAKKNLHFTAERKKINI